MDESPAVFTIVKYQVHILSGYIRLCAKLSEHHRLYRHNQERAYAWMLKNFKIVIIYD